MRSLDLIYFAFSMSTSVRYQFENVTHVECNKHISDFYMFNINKKGLFCRLRLFTQGHMVKFTHGYTLISYIDMMFGVSG